MAYSETARERRRCQARTKSGAPCHQYAVWGDPRQVCATHGGTASSSSHVCHCIAYAWPHRPGGGLCEWPAEWPTRRYTRPAGLHTGTRNRWGETTGGRRFIEAYRSQPAQLKAFMASCRPLWRELARADAARRKKAVLRARAFRRRRRQAREAQMAAHNPSQRARSGRVLED